MMTEQGDSSMPPPPYPGGPESGAPPYPGGPESGVPPYPGGTESGVPQAPPMEQKDTGYPPQDDPAYPAPAGGYPPPGDPAYPSVQQQGYPVEQQPAGYAPQQGYPPQQYPPQQPGGYPPQQQGGYPSPQQGYPAQQAPGAVAYSGSAGGQVMVVQPTNTTVVVQQQSFSDAPSQCECSNCHNRVTTVVSHSSGTFAWIMCFVMFICGLWLCCCIPFCVKSMNDTIHKCPVCKSTIFTSRRI